MFSKWLLGNVLWDVLTPIRVPPIVFQMILKGEQKKELYKFGLFALLDQLKLVFSYRRAEWCRILGVNPKQKRVRICRAHFSDKYIFGNRLTKYAVPNPPKSKKLKLRLSKSYPSEVEHIFEAISVYPSLITENNTNTEAISVNPCFITENNFNTGDTSVNPNFIRENNTNTEVTSIIPSLTLEDDNINIGSDYLPDTPIKSSLINNDEVVTESSTKINTGDFEIRQRDTNEVIMQLRCIETNNSIMLSFITPQKYALQQQIKNLDEVCSRQLKEIQELTTKNARLREKLKYYRVAMLQWRLVKPMNRYLSFKLKKFRQRATSLKRRLEAIANDKKSWDEFWSGLNY